jgi:signal transduction histidine kinase
MELSELLRLVRAVAFLGVGLLAVRLWWRDRSRPSAYLATAFGLLGAMLTVSLLLPADRSGPMVLLGHLIPLGVIAFPWLLAAFAWSFEGRLPAGLWAAGGALVVVGGWLLTLPPFVPGRERTSAQLAFVVAVLVLWGALSIAAAWRLWHAGGRQRLVRVRMRLLAGGAIVLALALWASVTLAARPIVTATTTVLALLSAGLFLIGFAPPRPVRLWWRRGAGGAWQEMQQELIAARTPEEVAAAVTPVLAELLGGDAAVVLGDRVLARTGMTDSEAQALTEVSDAGHPVPADVRVTPVDTARLVVRTTAYTPVFGRDEQELLEAFVLQLRIALERAQLFDAERRASRRAERARDELEATLLGLSHDLRSPAVAIGAYAALLRDVVDDAQRTEMLEQLERSADDLTSLVDSLLELARLGRVAAPVEPVDLAETVRNVAARLRATHPGVRVVVGPGLPVLLINRGHAGQLVDNLLRNAAQHGGRDDLTITVTSPPSRGVRLVVADDGMGIRPEDRDQVFTLFRRGRTTAPGSGIGLGLVRRIAEHYGGRIRLADSADGARFVLELPAELARIGRTERPQSAPRSRPVGVRNGRERPAARREDPASPAR